MKRKQAVQNSWLYKYRYPIAGVFLALIAAFMVSYRFWDAPTGLAQAEIQSGVAAVQLYEANPLLHPISAGSSLVNLPWSVLQWLSINLFGLSTMSLRLPAVLLTLLSVVLLIFLISRLMRPSIAMMTGLLLVSSSFMISIARSGTATAMTVLLIILLLLCVYYALTAAGWRRRTAVVGLVITSGLMCYMTAGPYILLAMLLVALLHPQTRLAIKRGRRWLLAMVAGLVVITLPLIIATVHAVLTGNVGDSIVSDLLLIGAPSLSNLVTMLQAYVGLQPTVVGGLVAPMLTIVGAALVVVGLVYAAVTARASVRFYALVGMIILALILGSCDASFVYLLFVPTIILGAMALAYITGKWYGLFPNNPYARVFAIIPIAILIGSLCSVDASRYFSAVSYNGDVVYSYDQTLPVLTDFIRDNQDVQLGIVVSDNPDAYQLYSILSLQYDNVEVASELPGKSGGITSSAPTGGKVAILGDSEPDVPDSVELSDIRTSWTKDHPVLLRAYTQRQE